MYGANVWPDITLSSGATIQTLKDKIVVFLAFPATLACQWSEKVMMHRRSKFISFARDGDVITFRKETGTKG